MYSNDSNQIRNGLVNYIGSSLKAVPYEGNAAKQHIIAMLLEEGLSLGISADETLDMFCMKPFFRSCKIIFEKRIIELEKLPDNSSVKDQLQEYKSVIKTLSKLINNINQPI